MISHKHKYIFIHVSKTGGSSIEQTLNPKITLDKRAVYKNTRNTRFADKHWSAIMYQQKYKKNYKDYFKFAFVRNPWDRMVSNYKWLRLIDWIDCSFDKWIADPSWGFNAYSYERMICDNSGSIIVDYIGRFETLQQDFDTVCDKIGIPKQQLPHANKTEHKHYTEYYDEETKQFIAKKYARDIELFGYKFGE